MKVYIVLNFDERECLYATGRVMTLTGACFSLNPFDGATYVTDPRGLKTSTVEIERESKVDGRIVWYCRIDTTERNNRNTGWFQTQQNVEMEQKKMEARKDDWVHATSVDSSTSASSDEENEENSPPEPPA